MSLRVVDDPPDRASWVSEAIGLILDTTRRARQGLLERVARASDVDLANGTDERWGLGQVAVHLLIVDRGGMHIALRLAQAAEPGPTGQPRPAASAVTRPGVETLAEKVAAAAVRLAAEFPSNPDTSRTARHPYYGDLNCFGWLLMLPTHYQAHLEALDHGRPSAL